ncbi:hydroxylamine reductase [Natrialba chahannaoensis JCM 10990]|uniref:Hydroxylamine reductase n=1 Tax=Natrialba chahannaoensis JCM 10990 TaxID=1227492 RepID=M0AFN7_9EURY|nr:hydroxylamine reductase [Natrialba chahannaoensis]ELY96158.1 hydroxylamine reductase [Natrialba chahannaoensis JCM 10990]
MDCNQCEQTPEGGCTTVGVCGKEPDLNGMQELVIYGLKGISAYATHARDMGYRDPDVDGLVHEALYSTLTNVNFSMDDHVDLAMRAGDAAVDVMELLDRAHTQELGVPEPTDVSQNNVKGNSILITGHDLYGLQQLLEQLEEVGEEINVYTHSEMLPAHGYPELAKYDSLKGNVGGAWHDQRVLFADFPGAIIGTTNCVQPPREEYRDRFFTTGLAGLEGVESLDGYDFEPVIEKAKSLPAVDWEQDGTVTTGFHHEPVLDQLDEIVDAAESGKLRHFFVVAGCDGPTPGRDYYRELVKAIPEDCVVMTTSCGKFRFNDLEMGTVPGTEIPRYVDLGQCNNSISTVKIALELADAFDCEVNELPLSVVLSWFEQKAIAVLLGLLSLGVEDIRLGPTVPEFLTPDIVEMLNAEFGLQPINEPKIDLQEMLDEPVSAAPTGPSPADD